MLPKVTQPQFRLGIPERQLQGEQMEPHKAQCYSEERGSLVTAGETLRHMGQLWQREHA